MLKNAENYDKINDEKNESKKHNDEYFIAIEFVFDKINKKVWQN